MAPNSQPASKEVDAYIAAAPAAIRGRLKKVRQAIRTVAPDATEVISYSMPGFSYPGYAYRGMFVWFALQGDYIGLYIRPPTIENHRKELAGYKTTKSAVHLPHDRDIPTMLIARLVRTSISVMKSGRP